MAHDPEKVIARALDRFALVESGWSGAAIKRAFATTLSSAPYNIRQADAILAELADAELVIVPAATGNTGEVGIGDCGIKRGQP